ncbi:MAG: cytochrome c biogenesis protein CcsA [Bacteroidetes bacterium]|nr:cytochrome c biogenesis protein CcsA [Bacteroidota bacterium]
MLLLARICENILPLAYCAAFAAYGFAFFRRDDAAGRWRRPALVTALVLHMALIYAQTMLHGHCLVYTPLEMLTLISFTVTLTYLIVELWSRERGTGMFFTGLALVLQTISSTFSSPLAGDSANPVLLNDAVGLHISAALIGYTAFSISAVYGVLYLMLYHQIRSNHFGTFYQRLPSLQLLERMSEKSSIVGVIFLAIAIVIGIVYLPSILPNFSYADPKLFVSIAVWGIYVAALCAKYIARVEGRKVVILSLVGFVGTIVSMTLINLVASGFHRFQ